MDISVLRDEFICKHEHDNWVVLVATDLWDKFFYMEDQTVFNLYKFAMSIDSSFIAGYFLMDDADSFQDVAIFIEKISVNCRKWVHNVLQHFPNSEYISEIDKRTDHIMHLTNNLESDCFMPYWDEYYKHIKYEVDQSTMKLILEQTYL